VTALVRCPKSATAEQALEYINFILNILRKTWREVIN